MGEFICVQCGAPSKRKGRVVRGFCGTDCYHKSRIGCVPKPERMDMPPIDLIQQAFEVDCETGNVFRKNRPREHFLTDRHWRIANHYVGKNAVSTRGPYNTVTMSHLGNKYSILAHRFIWAYVFGYWPKQLDHIDRNPRNNALSNLREATPQQNQANRGTWNRHGLKGIYRETTGKFRSSIKVNGRTIHLGVFETPEEAHDCYMKAARQYFGEFASC